MRVTIGFDETGLGALAGPIVTAGVILGMDDQLAGVRDSKKISSFYRRVDLAGLIQNRAIYWACAGASAGRIDKYGIDACHFACFRACAKRCLRFCKKLGIEPRREDIIVDGNRYIPDIGPHTALPGADSKILAVSAASIIAKALRDTMMLEFSKDNAVYNWECNFGYGTLEHRVAIERHGITSQHRTSYEPIKSLMSVNN